MINIYGMDDDADLGESLASNLNHPSHSSSSLSKLDMSSNQMLDNWRLSVHCTTSLDDYCDGELEKQDCDPCPSSSGFSYDLTSFPKSTSSAMSMFYPHLNSYDIHPLLMNQKRRPVESSLIDPPNLPPHPLIPDVSRQIIHKSKVRGKVTNRQSDYNCGELPNCDQTFIVDADRCQRKTFYCVACSKTFKFQTSLLRHNNKVHISKYQCQSCHRVFSRQAYLDVHTSKQGSSCYLANSYTITKSKK
ncbi:uncharacterized protein LOC126901171 isoform X2 [Daktulosphaira vitifoliae]|uniref:uncharacterized protein LOC126901171 isoform X2 n=1 Tax=Daktulosphaira vitifoliae TaxID=58002 RepID=UPI0021A98796|nr:uncharacterized protein LOC126901171 isoform X2 [Daktulosphaira vitifoliae]